MSLLTQMLTIEAVSAAQSVGKVALFRDSANKE